jgi:hypothetical protein
MLYSFLWGYYKKIINTLSKNNKKYAFNDDRSQYKVKLILL